MAFAKSAYTQAVRDGPGYLSSFCRLKSVLSRLQSDVFGISCNGRLSINLFDNVSATCDERILVDGPTALHAITCTEYVLFASGECNFEAANLRTTLVS